ncbi:hypothetical protein [Streptomyces torulosus]|nr:hypothetical protein [Streptomyces torulosus]
MTEPHDLTRGVRRTQYVLLLLMAALGTAGFLTKWAVCIVKPQVTGLV